MFKSIIYFTRRPLQLPISLITRLPYFKFLRETLDYQCNVNFEIWFIQKVLNIGSNKGAYWPMHYTSRVVFPKNIKIGIDTCPGLMKGCYIQGHGGIDIGDYTQIASNVMILSSNHDIYDNRAHISKKTVIGKYCWLGAGSMIMPGVELGDFTVVAAGSIVTKSFKQGYCVIGGNTAKIIKEIDQDKCVKYETKHAYYGYLNKVQFEGYHNN